MYSAIWLPIVTPFRNGQVDVDALQRLADHYLRTEISGFVALGTTGEAALLDHHERTTVLQALFEVVGTRLPIVVGVGGINTSEMVRDVQQFDHWDSGGYLVSAPAYICPDQRGIQWHFEEVARATDRPIVLYDVPHRTGVSIAPDTVKRLVECSNIVAIKACARDTFRALGALPISMLCGSDEMFVDCLEAGGAGGILASAHLFADAFVDIQASFAAGRIEEARAQLERLVPTIKLLFSAPNPAAIKAALAITGHIDGETCMPICAASSALMEQLRAALASRVAVVGAIA
jgi:4-hydroxy-tetrahydrodipicolinate synthase